MRLLDTGQTHATNTPSTTPICVHRLRNPARVVSAAATDPTTGPVRCARDVVPADLWDKQIGLLMRDYLYDSVMAARVLGQGYAYLLTAMKHRGEALGLALAPATASAMTLLTAPSSSQPTTSVLVSGRKYVIRQASCPCSDSRGRRSAMRREGERRFPRARFGPEAPQHAFPAQRSPP